MVHGIERSALPWLATLMGVRCDHATEVTEVAMHYVCYSEWGDAVRRFQNLPAELCCKPSVSEACVTLKAVGRHQMASFGHVR
jgi:hypothetical protein